MKFVVRCPFCDLDLTHFGERLRMSEAVRLHQWMIDHMQTKHRRESVTDLSIVTASATPQPEAEETT